jgi:hypothetical protein
MLNDFLLFSTMSQLAFSIVCYTLSFILLRLFVISWSWLIINPVLYIGLLVNSYFVDQELWISAAFAIRNLIYYFINMVSLYVLQSSHHLYIACSISFGPNLSVNISHNLLVVVFKFSMFQKMFISNSHDLLSNSTLSIIAVVDRKSVV